MPIVQMPSPGLKPKPLLDDVLTHLPSTDIQLFARGQEIYGPGNDLSCLGLVIQGRVKLLRLTESGVPVAVNVYHAGELFGESALLSLARRMRDGEQALAVDASKVMMWAAPEIAGLIEADPKLAVTLMHVVAYRCQEFKDRLESLSVEDTAHRLGRALLDFADRQGGSGNGAVTIAPLTHELLSQYVGTSREIISHHMSTLRANGFIVYSRQGILVQRDMLRTWLSRKNLQLQR